MTFTELVIDIFLQTGAVPGHRELPLAGQSRLLAAAFRSMATGLQLFHEGKKTTFAGFFGGGPVDSLRALTGRTEVPGLRRRPLWTDLHTAHVAAHVVLANRADNDAGNVPASSPLGSAYALRRFGTTPEWKPDCYHESLDLINQAYCERAQVAPRGVADTAPRVQGPCKLGHQDTAKHRDRGGWWHRIRVDYGHPSLIAGDVLCHKCYLTLQKQYRRKCKNSPLDDGSDSDVISDEQMPDAPQEADEHCLVHSRGETAQHTPDDKDGVQDVNPIGQQPGKRELAPAQAFECKR